MITKHYLVNKPPLFVVNKRLAIVISYSWYYTVGKNRPTLKLLNKLAKVYATAKWYDLGVELLAEEDVQALDEIQSNYPRDASMCCTKMFQLWLDKQPEASWRQLIEALRESNIELKELANTIEQKLITIHKGNYIVE